MLLREIQRCGFHCWIFFCVTPLFSFAHACQSLMLVRFPFMVLRCIISKANQISNSADKLPFSGGQNTHRRQLLFGCSNLLKIHQKNLNTKKQSYFFEFRKDWEEVFSQLVKPLVYVGGWQTDSLSAASLLSAAQLFTNHPINLIIT